MPVVKKGLLFDVTRCIGCGACYQACKERNHLQNTTADFLQDRLSEQTLTVVKQHNGRFVRHLCMHCEVPTCASACPVAALEKTPSGPVVYHAQRCIGCRYCMQACPFSIPKYQWSQVLPKISKCDLCADLLAADLPTACAQVCPTGATLCGERSALIAEAHRRIEAASGTYVNHVYGVEEVGGTSVLLLSDVPFDNIGYHTTLSKEPLPLLTWQVLSQVPRFASIVSVALLGLWWITQRRIEVHEAGGVPANDGDSQTAPTSSRMEREMD